MGYDDGLANRIRELTTGEPDVIEQRMSGRLTFLAAGNMVARGTIHHPDHGG